MLEDLVILHDLREVNVRVGFFFGSREARQIPEGCIAYSICWQKVDVRVELATVNEQISDLDFWSQSQRLVIDDHQIAGEVFDFRWEPESNLVSCKILLENE